MPHVSDNAGTAVATERPNIFCPPHGPGARDTGGAARPTAEGIFAPAAQPFAGLSPGAEARGRAVRRLPRVWIRARVRRGAQLVAGALALSLAAALLVPHGDRALPSRG